MQEKVVKMGVSLMSELGILKLFFSVILRPNHLGRFISKIFSHKSEHYFSPMPNMAISAISGTYSLNLRLCIFMATLASPPHGSVPAMGLLTPLLSGLPPGDSGLILMGDVWLMGERSALAGVPSSRLDPLLSTETTRGNGILLRYSLPG